MSVLLSSEVWWSVGHFPRVHLFYLQPAATLHLPVTFLWPSDRSCYDSDSGPLTGYVMIVTWLETKEVRAIYLNKSFFLKEQNEESKSSHTDKQC